jgi:hypothetical protein
MKEISPSELKKAVESQHGGRASLVQTVPVSDSFEGQPAWHGTIAVFELAGHPKATRPYAWTRKLPDGKTRTYAVLNIPPVDSPVAAVRAAIVAEQRAK